MGSDELDTLLDANAPKGAAPQVSAPKGGDELDTLWAQNAPPEPKPDGEGFFDSPLRSIKLIGRGLIERGIVGPLSTLEGMSKSVTGQASGFGQLAQTIHGALPDTQPQNAGERLSQMLGDLGGFGAQLAAAPETAFPKLMAGGIGALDTFGEAYQRAEDKGATPTQRFESALMSSAGAAGAAGLGPMGELAGPVAPALTKAAGVLAKLDVATKGAIGGAMRMGALGSAATALDALGSKAYGDEDRNVLAEAAAAFPQNAGLGAFLEGMAKLRPGELARPSRVEVHEGLDALWHENAPPAWRGDDTVPDSGMGRFASDKPEPVVPHEDLPPDSGLGQFAETMPEQPLSAEDAVHAIRAAKGGAQAAEGAREATPAEIERMNAALGSIGKAKVQRVTVAEPALSAEDRAAATQEPDRVTAQRQAVARAIEGDHELAVMAGRNDPRLHEAVQDALKTKLDQKLVEEARQSVLGLAKFPERVVDATMPAAGTPESVKTSKAAGARSPGGEPAPVSPTEKPAVPEAPASSGGGTGGNAAGPPLRAEHPDFVRGVLNQVDAIGAPGLSSKPKDYSAGKVSVPGHEVVYRAPDGTPVSVARVVERNGKLFVADFVTDKTRGLLGSRAAVAVGRELQRLGATEANGTISPDADRLAKHAAREAAPEPAPVLEKSTTGLKALAPEPVTLETTGIKHEVLDTEMAKLGLRTPAGADKIEHEAEFEKARERFARDPHAATRLVDALHDNPRELTKEEIPLLGLEANRRVLEREAAEVAAKEDPSIANEARVAKASEDYGRLVEAIKPSTSQQGQAFGLLRALVARDYSLARQERVIETAKGSTLTREELAKVSDLTRRIAALEKETSAMEGQRRPLPLKARETPVLDFLSKQADAARARIAERAKTTQLRAGTPTTEEMVDYALIGADHIARGVTDFAKWSAKMVGEFGEAVRPHLTAIFDRARTALNEDTRLRGAQARAEKKLAEIRGKVASGNVSKPAPREPVKPDAKLTQTRLEIAKAQKKLDEMRIGFEQKNRSVPRKAADVAEKVSRTWLISSLDVLVKLPAAAAWRMTMKVPNEAIGAALGKVPGLGGVASKSAIEGGFSAPAVAKYYASIFTDGMRQAGQVLQNKSSDINTMHGPARAPRTWLDWMGSLHEAIKTPLKVGEYEYALQKQIESNLRAGRDPTDPTLRMQMEAEAYKYANRQIFQQDNKLVDWWKGGLRSLETGKNEMVPGVAGKTLATGMRVVQPIVRTPTNIVLESLITSPVGAVIGGLEARTAFVRGIESLKPRDADAVMRHLKAGSIGSAAALLGWSAYKSIPGFYQPGKDVEDKDFGTLNLFGVHISKLFLHIPVMYTLNVFATAHHVADERTSNLDPEERGKAMGMFEGALGLLHEVPFVGTIADVGKMMDPNDKGATPARILANRAVPQLVQSIARHQDVDEEGNPIKRKATGLLENIQSGIPGQRQKLPLRARQR